MKNIITTCLMLISILAIGQQNNSGIERKGFVIGFSVGGGISSMSDSDQDDPFDEVQGGISLPNLKVGWMVNEKLAILASIPGIIYEYEGKDRSFDALIPSVQYWFNDRWWINGGAGLAVEFPALYEDDVEDSGWNFGGAVSLGSGIELIQKSNFALDLNSNLLLGRVNLDEGLDKHRDGVVFTVGLGFTWL